MHPAIKFLVEDEVYDYYFYTALHNPRDPEGGSALHWAVQNNHLKCSLWLQQNSGCDVRHINNLWVYCPLISSPVDLMCLWPSVSSALTSLSTPIVASHALLLPRHAIQYIPSIVSLLLYALFPCVMFISLSKCIINVRIYDTPTTSRNDIALSFQALKYPQFPWGMESFNKSNLALSYPAGTRSIIMSSNIQTSGHY